MSSAKPYAGRFVLSPLLMRLRLDSPRKESDLRDCTSPMIGNGWDCRRAPCRCLNVGDALEELARLGLATKSPDGRWVRTSLGDRVRRNLVVCERDRTVRTYAQVFAK